MTFHLIPQVYAASWDSINPECVSDGVATIKGIECLIQNILTPLPTILALVAVGMIIMAGIKIMTAGADSKAYAAGWSTFTYALIGLVLLSAVWLVLILIESYTGAPITEFGIPSN